jgi:tRNA dimethylallyltransferase
MECSLSVEYPLVAIVGPTASGKSALALEIATRLRGEVVNYDSVQVYRGVNVGAGKLSPEDRRNIPHHLLDCREPAEVFTAGDYRHAAQRALTDLRERGKVPILVGGTGLYLRALLLGLFEGPVRSEELRARLRALAERRSREFLHRLLRRLDPAAAERIQPRDKQKNIRALEVCLLARQPLSTLRARGRAGLAGYQVLKIGLNPERARLYARINQRVERMFEGGLMEEAQALLARPDAHRIKALEALGYRQACAVLRGEINLAEALRQTQAATRRYAKRQMTWFRRESGIAWFAGFGEDSGVQQQVLMALRQALALAHRSAPEGELPASLPPLSLGSET